MNHFRYIMVHMRQEKKSISIRFPLAVLEDIKQFADEDKRSINTEVLWILGEYSRQRKGGKRREKNVQVSDLSQESD